MNHGNKTKRNIKCLPFAIVLVPLTMCSDPVIRRTEVNGHGLMSDLYDDGGEGDSYEGSFEITSPDEARQIIKVPEDLTDKNIHLVLEVRDDGNPGLVSYRRIIISLKKQ